MSRCPLACALFVVALHHAVRRDPVDLGDYAEELLRAGATSSGDIVDGSSLVGLFSLMTFVHALACRGQSACHSMALSSSNGLSQLSCVAVLEHMPNHSHVTSPRRTAARMGMGTAAVRDDRIDPQGRSRDHGIVRCQRSHQQPE